MQVKKYLLSFVLVLAAPVAFANPVLENIGAGTVAIHNGATHVHIDQQSSHAILNWQSFNIAKPESVHFQQPANGVVLNRINPAYGASEIAGRLTATGNVFLSNPAGIHFLNSAKVDVAGLLATTGKISDKNFLNGNYTFKDHYHGTRGSISNAGEINAAEHGFVALVGQRVINTGTITAKLGQVALYSTNKFTLNIGDNDLIHFAVDDKTLKETAKKKNFIVDRGDVIVTGDTARNVLDKVVNIPEHFEARSVHEKAGKIILHQDDYVMVDEAMVDKAILHDYVVVENKRATTPVNIPDSPADNEYVHVNEAMLNEAILHDYAIVDTSGNDIVVHEGLQPEVVLPKDEFELMSEKYLTMSFSDWINEMDSIPLSPYAVDNVIESPAYESNITFTPAVIQHEENVFPEPLKSVDKVVVALEEGVSSPMAKLSMKQEWVNYNDCLSSWDRSSHCHVSTAALDLNIEVKDA